jgi:hypothetical protein
VAAVVAGPGRGVSAGRLVQLPMLQDAMRLGGPEKGKDGRLLPRCRRWGIQAPPAAHGPGREGEERRGKAAQAMSVGTPQAAGDGEEKTAGAVCSTAVKRLSLCLPSCPYTGPRLAADGDGRRGYGYA